MAAPLFVVVLAVYWRTLSPGALGGDAGELQFVPAILSLPHPTGTPLYILLGKLWSLLPLGPSVAWRMSLLAAVSAALATTIVFCCVQSIFESAAGAWIAAVGLAFGTIFWEQAVVADKYAFNALMVALVLALALSWGKTHSAASLSRLTLVYGLSLTHHRTMALFGPPLLVYVWWHERAALWRDGGRLLRLGLWCVAPLALYLYLPWAATRGLPPGTWRPQTLADWHAYLFDTGRTGLVYIDPQNLGERLLFYLRTLWNDWTPLGVALGAGGLATQFRRRPADALLLLVAFVVQAFLAANHHVPRHWVYFIPSFVILALWVGEGVAALTSRLRSRTGGLPSGRLLSATAVLLLTLVLLAGIATRWPARYRALRLAHHGYGILDPWRQTLKSGRMADRLGQAIATVAPQAVIACDWEQATPLWYYQQVEGLRADVEIVYPIERLDEAAAWGRPLYVARTLPGAGDRWHPSASGALVALRDQPATDLAADASPVQIGFGDVIALAGYRLDSPPRGAAFRAGDVAPLTLYWRAVAQPPYDYSVSLRLLHADGYQVAKVDGQHPVLGMSPTSRWQPGQVVADYYEIQLPPDLSPGSYRWGAILYRGLPEGGWESLRVNGSEAEFGEGGVIDVGGR
jgi:hypothetical protein